MPRQPVGLHSQSNYMPHFRPWPLHVKYQTLHLIGQYCKIMPICLSLPAFGFLCFLWINLRPVREWPDFLFFSFSLSLSLSCSLKLLTYLSWQLVALAIPILDTYNGRYQLNVWEWATASQKHWNQFRKQLTVEWLDPNQDMQHRSFQPTQSRLNTKRDSYHTHSHIHSHIQTWHSHPSPFPYFLTAI